MIHKAVMPVLSLPRFAKRGIVMAVDISLCILTVWLGYYLRMGEVIALYGPPFWVAVTSVVLAIPVFLAFGLYRAIFRYSGWPALLSVVKATSVYGILFGALITTGNFEMVPRTLGFIQPLLLLLAVGLSRAVARFWLGGMYLTQLKLATLPKVLIYGAGNSGRQLAEALSVSHEMQVVGFIDDDHRLYGSLLNGKPIYGALDLPSLVETLAVSTVLLALPKITRHRRNEILRHIDRAGVAVRTLPSFSEIAQGKVKVSDLRELDIDDLLGREPVSPDPALMEKNIRGKVVLVTGAGGSIGSELCRQILAVGPCTLLLLEQSEFALYNIHQELESRLESSIELIPLLTSVRNAPRIDAILKTWKPDTIYHAAAYKHVPLVEHNVAEGVLNNVIGTQVVATAAVAHGVSDFVLISTDKAVRPTNVMGASKRLAELVLQALAADSGHTRFAMVRFGNVLGSSGSVVPKFRQQIRDGGPITLTHPDITRYFMTIPEAAALVIQAGAMAVGGDVFVLDMGEPVKIYDLALRMIKLSGLVLKSEDDPEGDISIEITGLRPGEKLFEELLIGDNPQATEHPRIMKAHEDCLGWTLLQNELDQLVSELESNQIDAIRNRLSRLVSGYSKADQIVDYLHLKLEVTN